MVTIKTREQAVALRAGPDTYIAGKEHPGDLTITRTDTATIVAGSLRENRLRFIDVDGALHG